MSEVAVLKAVEVSVVGFNDDAGGYEVKVKLDDGSVLDDVIIQVSNGAHEPQNGDLILIDGEQLHEDEYDLTVAIDAVNKEALEHYLKGFTKTEYEVDGEGDQRWATYIRLNENERFQIYVENVNRSYNRGPFYLPFSDHLEFDSEEEALEWLKSENTFFQIEGLREGEYVEVDGREFSEFVDAIDAIEELEGEGVTDLRIVKCVRSVNGIEFEVVQY